VSVQARQLIDRSFNGLGSYALTVVIHAPQKTVSDPAFRRVLRRVEAKLKSEPAVENVQPPRADVSISPDRRTAVIQAGAARDPNDMVRAADELKRPLAKLGSDGVRVELTGAAGMWSGFNRANKSAMLKSELISWPVTLVILVVAFGSLVAAGLPLMLTIVGLIAAAGSLWIGTQIAGISIWAMNFALMFSLALGIDYALFLVYRFRRAFLGSNLSAAEATATTMDTAGKAVLFSGLTVLVSLSAGAHHAANNASTTHTSTVRPRGKLCTPTITAKTTDAANRTSDAIAANRRFTTSPIHEVASHDRETIGLSAVPFSLSASSPQGYRRNSPGPRRRSRRSSRRSPRSSRRSPRRSPRSSRRSPRRSRPPSRPGRSLLSLNSGIFMLLSLRLGGRLRPLR
jgi:hypothetical protein